MNSDYAGAVDPRCTAIGVNGKYNLERNSPDPTDERCRSNCRRNDPIPSDLLEQGWRYDHNGELLAPGEPDSVVVPEEVDE